MQKIKLLFLIVISMIIFTACGNKYSVENLKKDDKLLKETVLKCKEKHDEKICKNVEQAQNELALETWNKVKPEIKTRLDRIAKAMEAGDFMAGMSEVPEKYFKYQADKVSISVEQLKEMSKKMFDNFTKGVKVTQNSYDFENVKVGRTETGRSYAIIPTTVAMEVNGQTIETKGKSMAFEDENKWYIINFDKDFIFFLKGVYPDLAEVKVD
mgnify:CR=1 FL=1